MHGPAPEEPVELTPDERRVLRQTGAAVAARTRELLPDEFVVGSEVVAASGSAEAAVAVRPPGGSVVTTGLALGESTDHAAVAREIAAGAALAAKNTPDRHEPAAR